MKDGRRKGEAYMLRICRALSAWIGGTDPEAPASELVFRTRSTSIMPVEGHWNGKGDLLHRPGISFPFAVECKKDEKGKLDSILEASRWPVWDWWQQACEQAEKTGATPLLVFSRNRRKDYVMLPSRTAHQLGLLPRSAPVLVVRREPSYDVVIATLADLVAIKPSLLKKVRED